MSIALSEFWTRLVSSGIADAKECKSIADRFCKAHDGAPASDATTLAEYLVQTKQITAYQSRSLLAASFTPIRFGGFVQTSDQPSMPLGHWLPVKTILGQDANFFPGWSGRNGFLLRLPIAQASDSVVQWLTVHAGVSHEALQPIELYGVAGSDRELFTPLASGRSLADLTIKKMKVSRAQALTVSIAIANALSALHARSLIHGEVRADRVWMMAGGQPILLRDPSGPPRVPRADPALSWLHPTESPGGYAAPEFANASQACTVATDIYSLGCLMFRMFVGRMPMDQSAAATGSSLETEIAQHAVYVPAELNHAIEQGEAGDPVLRVIAYAMAKNPASRFSSAQQVADALTAIQASLSSPAAKPSKSKKKSKTANDANPSADRQAPEKKKEEKSPNKTSDKPSKVASASQSDADPPIPAAKLTTGKSEKKKAKSAKASPPSEPAKVKQPPKGDKKPAKTAPPVAAPPVTAPAAKPVDVPPKPGAADRVDAAANKTAKTPPQPIVKQSERPSAKKVAAQPPVVQPPEVQPTVTHPVIGQSAENQPAAIQPPSVQPPSIETAASPITTAAPTPTSESSPPRRRRRKKKNNLPFILGMLSIPLLATFILLVARGTGGSDSRESRGRPPVPTVVPPVASSTRNIATTDSQPNVPSDVNSQGQAKAGYQLVSSGTFPWAPPYPADSQHSSLALLPPGPAAVISLRLSSLMADPVGRDLVNALSPELSGLIKQAVDRVRMPSEDIKRLSVALHPGRDGWPQVSLAVELTESKPVKSLADLWQVSSARTTDGATIYAGDERDSDAFYLGDSQKGAMAPDSMVTRFAVGSMDQIKAVAENEGGDIPLARAMQRLWDSTSQESHVVALVTPNFLFADGRQMLATATPELVAPLKQMLITDVASVLLSATASGDVVYTELKAVPSGGISSAVLMRKLDAKIQTWPAWADAFSVDVVPDRSWRRLANRLPQMMRFLVDHTRLGVENDIVVANNYLPANAATQISVATLLAMNTQPGETGAASMASSSETLTIDQMLDRKMSIAFDQLSLEFAINAVADEFSASLPSGSTMPEVRIIGSDLQKMGITQNQQIRDFSRKDIPLRTVLTDIVLGANPDKTATGPGDVKQSLVWVVHEEAGKKVILVTTRKASDGQYDLPTEFRIAP
ncbi:protein kinase domain-containing protein [Planctomycetes bacterium K23_9]|uniref:Protein kinase domain protein n=1 Tax=Stieleria marina TaxID=1930275 RepID=A0A517NND8_9BACT|nr:Protein kinase domain protein [Planctomycetes bacterium K23_9]